MLVMRPIGRIVAMSRKVIAGDMTARVGIRPPGEMGVLCQAVDAMADAVAEREDAAQAGRPAAGHPGGKTGLDRPSGRRRGPRNQQSPDRRAHLRPPAAAEAEHGRARTSEDLDLIIHETTRAAEIVRGLLDFARERPTLMEPLDLNDVVRRTVRLIANQKKFEHIAIEEVLQDDLPEVCGDMNQLQQVLLNLSLNACAAMPNGGRLTIPPRPATAA